MQSFYRHILRESWSLSRKHLFLLPLAFFTSLVGIAGTFQVLFDIGGSDSAVTLQRLYTESDIITSLFVGWSSSFNEVPWMSLRIADAPMVFLFFFVLMMALALAIVITSSEGALISALSQLQEKKKTSYLVSFRRGLDKFWLLFSINLVYRLIYLGILSLIILPLIYVILVTGSSVGRLLLATVVYLVLIPLVIILDLVTRYSIMYIMIYNNTIAESFKNAWLLFRTNWIISIETSLLILASLFLAFIGMSFIVIPALVLLFTMFGSMVAFSTAVLQIFIITAIIILIAVVALFVSLFTTLQVSIWVGVFKKITSGQHMSKVHRLLVHLPWFHRSVN